MFIGSHQFAAPIGIGMFNTESSLHFYQIGTFDAFISMCVLVASILLARIKPFSQMKI
ncbi:MAG: hypothetical protein IJS02_00910 [Bacteroidales bacterium]|nr:hypothetical protein [Bacteroidales bacterium]